MDKPKNLPADLTVDTRSGRLQSQWMRLQSLVQHSSEGMLICNIAGEIMMANQQFCRRLGKSMSAVQDSFFRNLFPLKGNEGEAFVDYLKRVEATSYVFKAKKSTDNRFFQLRHVILEEDDEEKFVLIYVRETTADIRSSIKQQERGEMMIQMLENVQEPFILLDTGLSITAFNKAANELMVLSTGKALVKDSSILDYTDGDKGKEKAWSIYREALSGLLVEREIRIYPKGSSSPRVIRTTYKPFFDADGHVYGIFQGGIDITSELARSKAATEKQNMLQALTENTSDALLILDHQQRITFASKATERILGYAVEESLGLKGLSLLHPDDQLLAAAEVESILVQPELPINMRVRGIHKDGTTQWLQLKALNRLEDPAVNGLLIYISQIGAVRDLELERAAFEQLSLKMGEEASMAVFCFDEFDRLMLTAGAPASFFEAEEAPKPGTELQALLKPWGRKAEVLREAAAIKGATAFKLNPKFFGGKQVEASLFQLSEQPNRWALLLHDRTIYLAHAKHLREKPGIDKQMAELQQAFQQAATRQALLHRALICSFWRYEARSRTIHFDPNSSFVLPLAKHALPLAELEALIHPEDWKLFAFLSAEESSTLNLQQQFQCRLLAASGLYEAWTHCSVTQEAGGSRQTHGLWIKGENDTQLESNEQRNGALSEVLDKTNIGWILLEGEGQIWHINAKARSLLALEEAAFTNFYQIEGLRRTLLEAQLNTSRETQQRLTFNYFHAPSGRWLEVSIVPDLYATHLLLMEKEAEV